MHKTGEEVICKIKQSLKNKKVKALALSMSLLVCIIGSHFVFSKTTMFINDVPMNSGPINTQSHNSLDRFKIPVSDENNNMKIIGVSDFRHIGNYKVIKPSDPTKVKYFGMNCTVKPLENESYKMRCYNLNPQSKGFGMYVSNSYTVTGYKDEQGELIEDIQRISYSETFLLAYLFGMIIWVAAFFWPMVFSYTSTDEEDKVTSGATITS